MTLAPARPEDALRPSPLPVVTVLAVVVAAESGPGLESMLNALAAQTRHPDALLVIDATTDGSAQDRVAGHSLEGIASIVGVRDRAGALPQRLVTEVLLSERDEAVRDLVAAHDLLWFLSEGLPEPEALSRQADALGNSSSSSVAGPKLLLPGDGDRLRSMGYELTRSGRLVAAPPAGEPDQGQYDSRIDTLAVPFEGLLVDRALFRSLRGFDAAFGAEASDIDFGWRSQQAGRRVILVPRARVRVAERPTTAATRRQVRRVALSRCSVLAAPCLALWILLAALASALFLLLLKRPRAAWRELGDAGAVLNPLRPLASRWRSRGSRELARRNVATLFVGPRASLRHATDQLHEAVALGGPRSVEADAPADAAPVETGPSDDGERGLDVLPESWLGRVLRNPGVVATAAITAMTVAAGRSIGGGLVQRFESGLVGGDLVGTHASSATLWHAWLDSWKGSAFGYAGESSPSLVVLAALSWVEEHVPFADTATSPAGAAAGLLLAAALPLSAATAYVSGRAVTSRRWLRATAAMAWASTAVASTAIAGGRIGSAVALVLLPLVAAGFARTARPGGSATAMFATSLTAAVLGAFVPALLVLFAAASLTLLVVGRAGQRVRALVLLLLPVALQGPWLLELVRHPEQVLAGGPGLLSWGEPVPQAWQVALLHPGGAGSFPVLLSAPLLGLAVLGLTRSGRRSAALSGLAVLALVSLAGALAAPRVVLGTVPAQLAHAGQPITPWTGVALLPLALAVIAAALVGVSGLSLSRREAGWAAVVRWPLVLGAVATVLASAGYIGWQTFGDQLASWREPRPAVAVDQADSTVSNRMLFLEPTTTGETDATNANTSTSTSTSASPAPGSSASKHGSAMGFRVVGREASGLTRALPGSSADPARDTRIAPTVVALLGGQAPATSGPAQGQAEGPAAQLAREAIGFVGLRADETDPRIRALDATAGLVRSGTRDGVLVWRVLPPGASSATAPTRLTLVTGKKVMPVDTTGSHAATHTRITAPADTTLVVAEPLGWAEHASVRVDGRSLTQVPGATTPTYAVPPGPGTLTIDVASDDAGWRLAQGVLFALVLFLALPLGRRPQAVPGRTP